MRLFYYSYVKKKRVISGVKSCLPWRIRQLAEKTGFVHFSITITLTSTKEPKGSFLDFTKIASAQKVDVFYYAERTGLETGNDSVIKTAKISIFLRLDEI
jgi:hypothetical protein